jgi:UDP-glucose 4-epimerase
MVQAFEQASGKSIPCKVRDRREGDLASVVCDPAKAFRELSWKAKRSDLGTIMASAWKWQSQNPYGYGSKK